MATRAQPELQNRLAQDTRDNQETLLAEQVLHVLGTPRDLFRVQVCQLWQQHYRVNVLVGADITSARVAHGCFVEADCDGNIARAVPTIAKLY